MLDCHGTLDRPQLACLAGLLQRSIYVASALPNTEKGFSTIQISPATFCQQILEECKREDLPVLPFVIEDHAGLVLKKDSRLCHTSLSESMSSNDSGSDSDSDETQQSGRMTKFLFWITTPVRSTEHTREILNDTRDIVIRCIRKALPENEETADILDHLLAGAYLRQMMVVNTPDQGPNAQTAVFSVASFEDNPQTLIFNFLAGSNQTIREKIGPMNFPSHSNAMIALDNKSIEWLSTKVALNVATPPIDQCSDDGSDVDDEAEKIKTWEQCSNVQIPTVHFKSVSKSNRNKNNGYAGNGPISIVEVHEKKPYCDQFCVGVGTCLTNCFCQKPPTQETQEKAKPSSTYQTNPTLTKPLVR